EGGEQVGDGRTRAEADGHPALHQLGRRLGGESLLVVSAHDGATLFGYPQRSRLEMVMPFRRRATKPTTGASYSDDRDAYPGLQGRRYRPRRVRPQGDLPRRGGDAGPYADPGGVWGAETFGGRADHGLAPHDGPDRGADRDAGRA